MHEIELVSVPWCRVKGIIQIKRYSADDIKEMFKNRRFSSKVALITFVVSSFVNESVALFTLIDNTGLSREIAPSVLMDELHMTCKAHNPILYDIEKDSAYYKKPLIKEKKIINVNVDRLAGWMIGKGHMKKRLKALDWTNDLMDGLEEMYRLETHVRNAIKG